MEKFEKSYPKVALLTSTNNIGPYGEIWKSYPKIALLTSTNNIGP